jgi:hypothetical protein
MLLSIDDHAILQLEIVNHQRYEFLVVVRLEYWLMLNQEMLPLNKRLENDFSVLIDLQSMSKRDFSIAGMV